MSSAKQRAANRRNARQSTGPRTAAGKATSSANATRHGILSRSPVIEDAEDETDWQRHLASTLSALAPVGYIEDTLARRVALQGWRLDRVRRCEAALATARCAGFTAAEVGGLGDSLATSMDKFNDASRDREAYDHVVKMKPWETVPTVLVQRIFIRIAEVNDVDLNEVPLTPEGAESQSAGESTKEWSAPEVVRVATEIAKRGGTSPETALMLSTQCLTHGWDEKRRRMRALREQRLLPEAGDGEILLRYEVTLERSLFRTLHELERLQAHRSGAEVPVPAVVDLTVDSELMHR